MAYVSIGGFTTVLTVGFYNYYALNKTLVYAYFNNAYIYILEMLLFIQYLTSSIIF